jgi:hypothetical protein
LIMSSGFAWIRKQRLNRNTGEAEHSHVETAFCLLGDRARLCVICKTRPRPSQRRLSLTAFTRLQAGRRSLPERGAGTTSGCSAEQILL